VVGVVGDNDEEDDDIFLKAKRVTRGGQTSDWVSSCELVGLGRVVGF